VEKCVARHIFILRRVRLKILELWSGVVLCCVAVRWWWSCLYSGFESCSYLPSASASAATSRADHLFTWRLGEELRLGSIRFNSIQSGIRIALSSRLTPQHPSVLAPNIDSTRLWATSHKNHFPSSSLCFSSSQPITSHQDQQQRTIPSITISTQQLHLA
jgi:hypothetical protein